MRVQGFSKKFRFRWLNFSIEFPLVISGGVSSIEDIKRIKSLNNPKIEGVIIGKAIYDGDIQINNLAKLI